MEKEKVSKKKNIVDYCVIHSVLCVEKQWFPHTI